jgi:hypothetical protein
MPVINGPRAIDVKQLMEMLSTLGEFIGQGELMTMLGDFRDQGTGVPDGNRIEVLAI